MDKSFKSTVKKSANDPGVNPPPGSARALAPSPLRIQKARGQRLPCYLIKYGALLLLETKVVVEFSRIFERIDLSLAIGPKRDANTRCHDMVGSEDAVAKIALSRGAGTYCRVRCGEHRDFIRADVDRMNRCKVGAENAFSVQKFDGRQTIFPQARRILRNLFGDMHVKRKFFDASPCRNLFEIRERHGANAMWRNAEPHF